MWFSSSIKFKILYDFFLISSFNKKILKFPAKIIIIHNQLICSSVTYCNKGGYKNLYLCVGSLCCISQFLLCHIFTSLYSRAFPQLWPHVYCPHTMATKIWNVWFRQHQIAHLMWAIFLFPISFPEKALTSWHQWVAAVSGTIEWHITS